MYALADCNNFYASCQRIFRPELENKPIVVLSNNDGCVIARSNEAKALHVPMGAIYYQWKTFFKQNNIYVFSSNYPLYADISARVMSILKNFEADIEVYSIDEAFLNINDINNNKHPDNIRNYALNIRQTTLQWTGMPISIGIAQTKTLAKLANHIAKKQAALNGVLVLNSNTEALPYLKKVAIADIWGVGRNWAKKLSHNGIKTAADLAFCNHSWIRKRYSVMLQRTAMELAGQSCIEMEHAAERQQILVSRSFRPKVSDYPTLHRFISAYISRAAEKLRSQNSLTKNITIFIHTNNHQANFYSNAKSINLSQYTADTSTLIKAAGWVLKQLFKCGYDYYKAGVILADIIPEKNQQYALFSAANYDEPARKRMQLLDDINHRFGPETLSLASEPRQRWQMYQKHLSPAYTTRWDEILKIK